MMLLSGEEGSHGHAVNFAVRDGMPGLSNMSKTDASGFQRCFSRRQPNTLCPPVADHSGLYCVDLDKILGILVEALEATPSNR